MNRRKVSVIAGIVILVIAIVVAWFLVTNSTEQASQEPPVEVIRVPTINASPNAVVNRIRFTGRVIPEVRFDIYSEVTGRLMPTGKAFKTGTSFQEGEPIVTLNDDEQRQQLEAARYEFSSLLSRTMPDISIDYPDALGDWQQYLQNFDATQPLPPLPEVENEQLRMFLNGRNIFSTYSNIRQQEVRLNKFTIRAPFDGVVTESLVDPGALVQPNQRLGEFTKLEPVEIEASIPAEQAQYIQVGDEVQLNFQAEDRGRITARVARKNAKIEPSSQSVKIYMKVTGSNFRPGTYVEGNIRGNTFQNALRIHQDVLVRDNDIFVIRDSVAAMQQVQVLSQAGDSVTVTGIEPGTIIVDDFREPAFEGTKVAPLGDQ